MRNFLHGEEEGEGEGRGKTSKTFVRKVLQGYKLSASRVEKGWGWGWGDNCATFGTFGTFLSGFSSLSLWLRFSFAIDFWRQRVWLVQIAVSTARQAESEGTKESGSGGEGSNAQARTVTAKRRRRRQKGSWRFPLLFLLLPFTAPWPEPDPCPDSDLTPDLPFPPLMDYLSLSVAISGCLGNASARVSVV